MNDQKPFRYISLCVILILAGCTPWRAAYLAEEVGHASQDDVAKRLGPPMSERSQSSGETIWLYRYMRADEGTTACAEYILTFDTGKVLRSWNRQRC
jgi:hypothetical protein